MPTRMASATWRRWREKWGHGAWDSIPRRGGGGIELWANEVPPGRGSDHRGRMASVVSRVEMLRTGAQLQGIPQDGGENQHSFWRRLWALGTRHDGGGARVDSSGLTIARECAKIDRFARFPTGARTGSILANDSHRRPGGNFNAGLIQHSDSRQTKVLKVRSTKRRQRSVK